MELSTSIPTPRASPKSVMKLIDSFMAHMRVNVIITEIGIAEVTIRIGLTFGIITAVISIAARRRYNNFVGKKSVQTRSIAVNAIALLFNLIRKYVRTRIISPAPCRRAIFKFSIDLFMKSAWLLVIINCKS